MITKIKETKNKETGLDIKIEFDTCNLKNTLDNIIQKWEKKYPDRLITVTNFDNDIGTVQILAKPNPFYASEQKN